MTRKWLNDKELEELADRDICFYNLENVRIHRTAQIGNGAFLEATDSLIIHEGVVIGKDVVLVADKIKVGSYSTVLASIEQDYGNLTIPPGSYVENVNKPACRYWAAPVIAMYTPSGIKIKPGCRDIEPIGKTLKRLAYPMKIEEYESYEQNETDRTAWCEGWTRELNKLFDWTVE